MLTTNTPVTGYRVNHDFPGLGAKTMLVNARKVPAMDHRSARLLLAFEDVTDAEDRVASLRSHDQRKDEFIAMLAHELRNPLAPIRNAVQLLGMKLKDEALRQPLDMIGRQVATLTRLVNDLMDISRITRGELAVDRVPIDLVDLLAQAVNAALPFVEQRGHQFTAMLPDAGATVSGDGTRLEQVFGNLLNNAAKYTDRGGHIVLGLSVLNSEAVVTVTDDGAGIAPAILPHVFDLFVQSDATRSRADGGLGIGLTLVRQIVEIHGGSVRATSGGLGQGSVFTVRLPIIQATVEEAQLHSDHVADVANFRPRRVLVVDDNIDSANSIGELIRIWGHEVALAYDGFVGIEVARTFVPDVALLEIGLPTMDGYVLARELRKLQADGLFLIAMTGYGQEADRQAAQQAGFDVHMVKPVGVGPLEILLATLHK